jgi:hypothetical protein
MTAPPGAPLPVQGAEAVRRKSSVPTSGTSTAVSPVQVYVWIAHALDPLRELVELKDVPRITGSAAGPSNATEPVTEPRPGREPDELGASPMLPPMTVSARGGTLPVTGSTHPFAMGIAEQSRIVRKVPPPNSCASACVAKVTVRTEPANTAATRSDLTQRRIRIIDPKSFEPIDIPPLV